jgi:hypothetical protein
MATTLPPHTGYREVAPGQSRTVGQGQGQGQGRGRAGGKAAMIQRLHSDGSWWAVGIQGKRERTDDTPVPTV